MAGTIENAIYADKLDADGNLWTPDEPDPTLDRCMVEVQLMTPPSSAPTSGCLSGLSGF